MKFFTNLNLLVFLHPNLLPFLVKYLIYQSQLMNRDIRHYITMNLPITMILVSFKSLILFNFLTKCPNAMSTLDNAVLNKYLRFVLFVSAPCACVFVSGSLKYIATKLTFFDFSSHSTVLSARLLNSPVLSSYRKDDGGPRNLRGKMYKSESRI